MTPAKIEMARKAIERGRTMGQFLRDLPGSVSMTPAELQTYSKAYVLARDGSIEVSSEELTAMAWPNMSKKARQNWIASWFLTGNPFPEFTRLACGCLPNEACPHALADVFSIPVRRK